MSADRKITYTVDVEMGDAQRRIGDLAKSVEYATASFKKLMESGKTGEIMESSVDQLTSKYTSLAPLLRRVREEIEQVTRAASLQQNILDENGKTVGHYERTIEQLRGMEKAIEDCQKAIKNGRLNNIIEKDEAERISKVNAAIKEQTQLIKELEKATSRHKALNQSNFDDMRKKFEEQNKILQANGESARQNPFESWVKHVENARKQVVELGQAEVNLAKQRETIERNLAESKNAREAHYKAQEANAAKQLQAMRDVLTYTNKWEAQVDKVRRTFARGTKLTEEEYNQLRKQTAELEKQAIIKKAKNVEGNPFNDARYVSYANYANTSEEIRLGQKRNQLEERYQAQIDKINTSISRGRTLNETEYEILKRKTAELERQAQIAGARNMEPNPLGDGERYGSLSEYNAAALANRAANAERWAPSIRTYSNEINRLQASCEELYRTYKKDPSEKNLRALANAQNAVKGLRNEYNRFSTQINNTGGVLDDFMIKAKSHLAWIASGSIIAGAAAIPTIASDAIKDLDYQMAGIRQVIPQIEALQDGGIVRMNDGSKVYEDSATQLQRMNQAMTDFLSIASKYGQETSEVMEAAKSIGRMYGQGEDGLKNTEIFTGQAAKMSVADAFSMLDATKGLEAAMSQWNLQTTDSNNLMANSQYIIDVWTRTAHSGAASGQDLGQAIEVAGTAAAQAGVSFDMFASLVEVGCRTTARSGNEVGQAIKSMMVSMQNDKSQKALKEWGISLKEIGKDGKEHVRSMEDVIMDVSALVSTTDKDTTKLLSTLSGGKYQYSKVSAILKNYKELLRMQGILNDGNTKGFADEQVKIQLDTLQRQIQTLKADTQSLFADIGKNGGLDTLKWMIRSIDNVVVGMTKINDQLNKSNVNLSSILKTATMMLVTYKAIQKVVAAITAIGTAYKIGSENAKNAPSRRNRGIFADSRDKGRMRGIERAWSSSDTSATAANTAAENVNTTAIGANSSALGINSTARGTNTAQIVGNTAALGANTTATSAGARNLGNMTTIAKQHGLVMTTTGAAIKNNSSVLNTHHRLVKLNAEGMTRMTYAGKTTASSVGGVTTKLKGLVVASRLGAGALSLFSGALTAGRVALAAFGGPIGLVVTGLSFLVPAVLSWADAEGEAANAQKRETEAMDEKIAKAREDSMLTERRGQAAEKLATQYNNLKDKIDSGTLSEKEAIKTEEQMVDIKNTIGEVLQVNADQVIENGKVNIDTVRKMSETQKAAVVADLKGKREQIRGEKAKIDAMKQTALASSTATNATIENAKARLKTMQQEGMAAKALGNTYSWLYNVIGNTMVWAANKLRGLRDDTEKFLFGAEPILSEVPGTTAAKANALTNLVNNISDSFLESMQSKGLQYISNASTLTEEGNQQIIESAVGVVDNYKVDGGEIDRLSQQSEALGNQLSSIDSAIEEIAHPEWFNDNASSPIAGDGGGGKAKKGKGKGSGSGHHRKVPFGYTDEASHAMYTGTQQYGEFSKKGLDMPTMLAAASMITGNDSLNFDATPDIFRNGASNPWDSTYTFVTKMHRYFNQGKNLEEALASEYPDIDWSSVGENGLSRLDNAATYLKDNYNFQKATKDRFNDPNEQSAMSYAGVDATVARVIAAAEKYGVDKEIALKIAKGESDFDQGTVSDAGAIGVMQLMPDTARGLNVDPYDEVQNIDGGVRYFAQILQEFGTVNDALRAYNAGPKGARDGYGDSYRDYILGQDVSSEMQGKSAEIGKSIGDAIVADADANVGQQWRGIDAGFDGNATWDEQCASWVSYQMQKHGINISSQNVYGVTEQAGDAYQEGRAPQNAGDILRWDGHVGFYDGNGGYVARDSSGGIHHGTLDYAATYFGQLLGSADIRKLAANNGVQYSGNVSRWNRLNDSTLANEHMNPVTEREWQDKLQKQIRDDAIKTISITRQIFGDTFESTMAENAAEDSYLVTQGQAAVFWKNLYTNATKALRREINSDQGILKALGGQNFESISPEYLKEIAKATKDKKFQELVSVYAAAKDKSREANLAYEEGKVKKLQRDGYMTPEQQENYELELHNREYESKKAGMNSENPQWARNKAMQDLVTLNMRKARQEAELSKANAVAQRKIEELNAEAAATKAKIDLLEKEAAAHKDVSKELKEQNKVYEQQKALAAQVAKFGTEDQRKLQKALEETNNKIKETNASFQDADKKIFNIFTSGFTTMFQDVLIQGKGFKESMNKIWQDIANFAIQRLLEIHLYSMLENALFLPGRALGGHIGRRATGGTIPGYSSGGQPAGAIHGAGDGTSDSILAYIADKDRFVYLSNGEYVMTAEATRRIGVGNLDKLNYGAYASGGSLTNPIPYVPQLSSSVNKKADGVNRGNPNAKMEKLIEEQTGVMREMNGKGNNNGGGLVVLNTHASSADVLKALHENPRALQAILGKQKHMGFR